MSGSDSSLEEPDDASRLRLALAAAQGRLRLLSAHTSGIIFELNAQGRFVRVWASDPSLLARPEPELIGRTVSEAIGPELGAVHDNAVREALRSGRGNEYEYELAVPGGTLHFAASSVVVPADTDSTERAVIVWIRDITEQVRTRAKLLQHERLAALGRLAAGVAHEINNPLGYMVLNIGRMRRQISAMAGAFPDAEKKLEDLEAARALVGEGTERVRKIVRELTNFARIEDDLERVDLARIIALALDLAQVEEQERVRIVRQFEPAPEVMADEGRLVQVFLNLIDNAVSAMIQQPPELALTGELRLSTRTDEQGRAVAEVHDTGAGVPQALQDRVFDPFYTTKAEGVGLGLTLCQTLVTSFSGELTLSSEPGEGTTVRITLPAASNRLSEDPLSRR